MPAIVMPAIVTRALEIVTASAGWARLLATRLEGGRPVTREIGPREGRQSFASALACT